MENLLPLRELTSRTVAFRRRLPSGAGSQLRSPALRDEARLLVTDYFTLVRPLLVVLGLDAKGIDSQMQLLLTLANHASLNSRYRTILRSLESSMETLEAGALLTISNQAVGRKENISLSTIEKRISDTLSALMPNSALSYIQVIQDLAETKRKSYRGTATELREILREVLDHLAADAIVIASPGFVLEPDRDRPTMAQKARYILRQRGLAERAIGAPKKSIEAVEQTVAALVRSTYDRGSIDTHTSNGIARPQVQQLKMYVDGVLCELLEVHTRNA